MKSRLLPAAACCGLALLSARSATPVKPFSSGEIRLEPSWTRLADPEGKIDEELKTESAESAEFSPDGTLIAAGSKGVLRGESRHGQRVSLWRVADGEMVWERPRAEEVEAVSFSADGKLIAAGGEDKLVEILNASDGSLVTSLNTDAAVDALRFSPDGSILAVGTEAQQIVLYRANDWSHLSTTRHGGTGNNAVNQIDWTSDGSVLASAGTNGEVKIWNVNTERDGAQLSTATLELLHTASVGATVKSIRISPDDRLLAVGAGEGKGVLVYELSTAKRITTIPATAWTHECVEFHPDGGYLLTGGNEGENNAQPQQLKVFPANNGQGAIRIYQIPSKDSGEFKLVHTQPTFRQEYLSFTKDGKKLVTSHEDGSIRLWTVHRK